MVGEEMLVQSHSHLIAEQAVEKLFRNLPDVHYKHAAKE